jgi:hypothetical protein
MDVVMPGMSGGDIFPNDCSLSAPPYAPLSEYTEDAITHRGVLGPGVHFFQSLSNGLARSRRTRFS